MARGNLKIRKNPIEPDKKHGSVLLARFINYIMQDGKKSVAENIVYTALEEASKQVKEEPLDLFTTVLQNVGPIVEIRGKRIGGANYQVPVEVSKDRKNVLAMRWIIAAAKSGKGKPMAKKLSDELVSAYNNEGAAIKRREEVHRMAEANKAFAHFARF